MEKNKDCKCDDCNCKKDKVLNKAKKLYNEKLSKDSTVYKLMPNGNILK